MNVDTLLQRYISGDRNFSNAKLSPANLIGVQLSGTNLIQANLSQALLRQANNQSLL